MLRQAWCVAVSCVHPLLRNGADALLSRLHQSAQGAARISCDASFPYMTGTQGVHTSAAACHGGPRDPNAPTCATRIFSPFCYAICVLIHSPYYNFRSSASIWPPCDSRSALNGVVGWCWVRFIGRGGRILSVNQLKLSLHLCTCRGGFASLCIWSCWYALT